jgi:N-acetylglucosaminyldiphosphoundecaprenol N-acetyl-beta-D-mannosaminyltransferase
MFNRLNVMSYDVFNDDLSMIKIDTDKKIIVNTINSHSYITAKEDEQFRDALNKSDILLPDGSGMVLAAKVINKSVIKKIAGSDFHYYLLKELNKSGGKCFYMGASEDTLMKIEQKIAKEFPNIIVESYSPPFKAVFSKEENDEIISKINAFKPAVLFIGMTAPKQEKWLDEHKEALHFNIATSIGAVFDFYAGKVERPAQFWLDLHLEWLVRLLNEPKRLWRRNFISTPLFLIDMSISKFKA